MRYLSICSGIEAATVAWEPLGWEAVAYAEIEKFPAALLAHYYPNTPNLGGMTKIKGEDYRGTVDVLVGGTPCQAFSVAGLRAGLIDPRGNLTLVFAKLADDTAPPYVVWENVPGVLSSKDNAFGCFLGLLAGEDDALVAPGGKWTDAGYVLGPQRTVEWRVFDAQYFGLAQRRRRVFVVACPRGGADPREILFEREGLRRDTAPSREAGQGFAADASGSSHWSGGPHPSLNQSAKGSGGVGSSNQELFSQQGAYLVPGQTVAGALKSCGCFQSSQSGVRPGDTHAMPVRRLTPRECERLQGFPDDYTQIPWKNKPAEVCPGSPRYKALGNSMAVPCMRWIGKRIAARAAVEGK